MPRSLEGVNRGEVELMVARVLPSLPQGYSDNEWKAHSAFHRGLFMGLWEW